jgi:Tripartite tricarboxylate transporter TctB family
LKIKSQKDFWSGLMFIVIGALFAWGSTQYSMGASARPGPGYFPFGLSILMAILGAMVMFKSLTLEVEGGDPIGDWAWRPLLVICGSVAGFGLLLPLLGMFITLPLLVLCASAASHEFSWKGVLINAVVLTAFSWAIFILGLKLTIPLLPTFLGT